MLINGHSLIINSFFELVFGNSSIELDDDAMKKVIGSYEFLNSFSDKKLIYGINTGFGPMAQYQIPNDRLIDLQYNIIRSHSSGLGEYLEKEYCKAVLVNLINAMLRGFSGVTPELLSLLKKMYECGIIPCIPMHGGVGASGDLVQMAHLGLAVIGEGDVYYNDQIIRASKAFAERDITPLQIRLREGISIMNGTTAMTAVAAINTVKAQRATEWSLAFTMMINEMMDSFDDHISEKLSNAKRQEGQKIVAKAARDFVNGSKLILSREKELYKKEITEEYLDHKVQEYYSLRCIPQILGPIYDTLCYTQQIVENELNSTTDNPVVDVESQNVYHGGNFHGDYISLEMDKLKLVMTRVSMLAERQLNYLVNPSINQKLQPFINVGTLGLNFGMQGIQFTATSTTAENQSLSNSMYVHSIPNNNDNQDIVSMGFNAACITKKVIENTFEVLAIEGIAVLQAVDQLQIKDQMSQAAQNIYTALREQFAVIDKDRSTREDTMRLKNYLIENPLKILF